MLVFLCPTFGVQFKIYFFFLTNFSKNWNLKFKFDKCRKICLHINRKTL